MDDLTCTNRGPRCTDRHRRAPSNVKERADAKERFGIDRQRMVDIGDAEALEMLATLPEDADREGTW